MQGKHYNMSYVDCDARRHHVWDPSINMSFADIRANGSTTSIALVYDIKDAKIVFAALERGAATSEK